MLFELLVAVMLLISASAQEPPWCPLFSASGTYILFGVHEVADCVVNDIHAAIKWNPPSEFLVLRMRNVSWVGGRLYFMTASNLQVDVVDSVFVSLSDAFVLNTNDIVSNVSLHLSRTRIISERGSAVAAIGTVSSVTRFLIAVHDSYFDVNHTVVSVGCVAIVSDAATLTVRSVAITVTNSTVLQYNSAQSRAVIAGIILWRGAAAGTLDVSGASITVSRSSVLRNYAKGGWAITAGVGTRGLLALDNVTISIEESATSAVSGSHYAVAAGASGSIIQKASRFSALISGSRVAAESSGSNSIAVGLFSHIGATTLDVFSVTVGASSSVSSVSDESWACAASACAKGGPSSIGNGTLMVANRSVVTAETKTRDYAIAASFAGFGVLEIRNVTATSLKSTLRSISFSPLTVCLAAVGSSIRASGLHFRASESTLVSEGGDGSTNFAFAASVATHSGSLVATDATINVAKSNVSATTRGDIAAAAGWFGYNTLALQGCTTTVSESAVRASTRRCCAAAASVSIYAGSTTATDCAISIANHSQIAAYTPSSVSSAASWVSSGGPLTLQLCKTTIVDSDVQAVGMDTATSGGAHAKGPLRVVDAELRAEGSTVNSTSEGGDFSTALAVVAHSAGGNITKASLMATKSQIAAVSLSDYAAAVSWLGTHELNVTASTASCSSSAILSQCPNSVSASGSAVVNGRGPLLMRSTTLAFADSVVKSHAGDGTVAVASVLCTHGHVGVTDFRVLVERSNVSAVGTVPPIAAVSLVSYGGVVINATWISVQSAHLQVCGSNVSSKDVAIGLMFDAQSTWPADADESVAMMSVLVLASWVSAGPAVAKMKGNCLAVVSSAAAPATIRDTVVSCSGSVAPGDAGFLFASTVRNASGADVTEMLFPAANRNPHEGPYNSSSNFSSCLFPQPDGRPNLEHTATRTRSHTALDATLTLTAVLPLTTLPRASLPQSSTPASTAPPSTSQISTATTPVPSMTGAATPDPIPVPPTDTVAPPPSPPRVAAGSVQLTVLMPQDAGETISATATTSIVVSSVVGPTAASQAVRLGAAVRTLQCALISDDEEPSFLELPLQTSIGLSNLQAYTGSTFLCTVFLVVSPFLVHLIAMRLQARSRVQALTGAVHAVCTQYFVPNCAAGVAVLLGHGTGSADLSVGLISAAAIIGVTIGTVRRIVNPSSLAPHGMAAFTDGAADMEDLRKRLFSIEELAVSTLVAVVSGARRGKCSSVAIALTAIITVHLAYLIVIRPHRSKLDFGFAVGGCCLQLGLNVAVAHALLTEDPAPTERPIAVLVVILFSFFLIQSAVVLFWTFTRTFLRKRRVASSHAAELGHALLGVPVSTASTSSTATDGTTTATATTSTTPSAAAPPNDDFCNEPMVYVNPLEPS